MDSVLWPIDVEHALESLIWHWKHELSLRLRKQS